MSFAPRRTEMRAAANRRPGPSPGGADAAAPRPFLRRRPQLQARAWSASELQFGPRCRPLRSLLFDQARRLPGFRTGPPKEVTGRHYYRTSAAQSGAKILASALRFPADHGRSRTVRRGALFFETITHAVQRFDHIEFVVAGLELL